MDIEYAVQKSINREAATAAFGEAQKLAHQHGLDLERHSPTHYSLTKKRGPEIVWRLNIYPGNRRLWWDRNFKMPFFVPVLDMAWGLLDVVKAAIEKGRQNDEFPV